jgi:translation initiation factor IF-3
MANPSFGRPSYNRRHQQQRGPRKNDRIRVPEVRLIGSNGQQIGVIATREALQMARSEGLDLLEVSPNAQPPVCRILDYGKYMYEESKKQKGSKSTGTKLKEVKLRTRIETHDYVTKLRHAEEFLNDGNKVKLSLFFRGREMEHPELGMETIMRAINDLKHIGTADNEPRHIGRNIILTLSPLPPNKRKLIFNAPDEEEDEEDQAAPKGG